MVVADTTKKEEKVVSVLVFFYTTIVLYYTEYAYESVTLSIRLPHRAQGGCEGVNVHRRLSTVF